MPLPPCQQTTVICGLCHRIGLTGYVGHWHEFNIESETEGRTFHFWVCPVCIPFSPQDFTDEEAAKLIVGVFQRWRQIHQV